MAEVVIRPNSPPIIIPPQGGSFTYEATITNISNSSIDIEVWTVANVPGLGYYGPLIMRSLHLSPHQTIYRPSVTQNVPGYAPAGDYHYIAYVGNYPEKMDSSSFEFSKAGKSAGDRWSIADWSETTDELNLPLTASLLGSYPNPFNGSTTIGYELAWGTEVRLEIFTPLGQKVATLVDGWQQAGRKSITWDASGVSSGVYFCKLTVGSFTQTRRMLFAK